MPETPTPEDAMPEDAMPEDAMPSPPPQESRPRRFGLRWTSVAKWAIAVVVVIGLFLAASNAAEQWRLQRAKLNAQIAEVRDQISRTNDPRQVAELRSTEQSLRASVPRWGNLRWSRIAIASLLYAVGLVPPSFLLRRALVSLGQSPSVGTAVAAQLIGHAGKYVPGKAMVVVLRAGALSRDGVRPLPATVSVFLETFLMMAVGASIAGLIVVWLPVPRWIALAAIVVAVLASLPTLPPMLRVVAARVAKVRRSEVDSNLGVGLFLAGWVWSAVSWILIGASFSFLVSAIPTSEPLPPAGTLMAICTAAISLAIVVGFASLLPGGAGVRELVLTTVLGAAVGSAHGLIAAIAARIMFIVVEAVLAGGSWWWLRRG